ncbi:ATP synthase subunit g, mitochondrial [Halotydeus destructor]|nr:ATP synthase subunit g, mitochondrial [Halotydeus destructor]
MSKLISKIPVLINGAITAARPKANLAMRYAAVELTPPSPTEIPEIGRRIGNIIRSAKTGKWRQLSVKEAWLNTIVSVEVLMWFFIGECIGKGSLVGYQV